MAKRLGELDVGSNVVAADKLLVQQSGVDKQVPASELPLPLNDIAGLITSNGTDADHDIDIAAGVARSADDVTNMVLAAVLTKQIDAAWAVGDDAGGIDAGSVANNTLYAIWLIKRSDTGVVDALFLTSFSAPTMPTDYDSKRLIATVKTDGSANLYAYTQQGAIFEWGVFFADVNAVATASTTKSTQTLSAPPGSIARVAGTFSNSTAAAAGGVPSLMSIEINGGLAGANAPWITHNPDTGIVEGMGRGGRVLVDGSSQIEIYASYPNGAATITVKTLGFEMLTRRDP